MFWSIEPPVVDRLEIAIANLAALTANLHRDRKSRPEPFTFENFRFNWSKIQDDEPSTDEGMAPETIMPVMESFLKRQQARDDAMKEKNRAR